MTYPKYLEPFFDGTPLAVERIKTAWPGLSNSDRAYLLSVLLADRSKEQKAMRWVHHRGQLADLALEDGSAYIRYLAAKHVSEPYGRDDVDEDPHCKEDRVRYEKVQSDSLCLIQCAEREEGGWADFSGEFDDPEAFWKRPQTERLVLVNGVKEAGEKIAALLRYATKYLLPNKVVTETEMFDVLLQYLGWRTISERVADSEDYAWRFYDGFAECKTHNSVTALWELVPDIPRSMTYALIDSLPEKVDSVSIIPLQVIESLDEKPLQHLLYRDDIELKDLRRKLYKESTNDVLRQAAIASRQFELMDSDISELVYDTKEPVESGKKKVEALSMLAMHCRGATLVQMQAICDLILDAPSEFSSFDLYAMGPGHESQTARAKRLPRGILENEVFAMRLFSLAKWLSPIKSGEKPGRVPEKLRQHQGIVVPHNPWQTYLNISKVLCLDNWRNILDYLPTIYLRDFNLPDDIDESHDNNAEQGHSHLSDLLEELKECVRELGDKNDQDSQQLSELVKDVQCHIKKNSDELSDLSGVFSTISIPIQNVDLSEKVDSLESKIKSFSRAIKIISWMVIVLLILILFK